MRRNHGDYSEKANNPALYGRADIATNPQHSPGSNLYDEESPQDQNFFSLNNYHLASTHLPRSPEIHHSTTSALRNHSNSPILPSIKPNEFGFRSLESDSIVTSDDQGQYRRSEKQAEDYHSLRESGTHRILYDSKDHQFSSVRSNYSSHLPDHSQDAAGNTPLSGYKYHMNDPYSRRQGDNYHESPSLADCTLPNRFQPESSSSYGHTAHSYNHHYESQNPASQPKYDYHATQKRASSSHLNLSLLERAATYEDPCMVSSSEFDRTAHLQRNENQVYSSFEHEREFSPEKQIPLRSTEKASRVTLPTVDFHSDSGDLYPTRSYHRNSNPIHQAPTHDYDSSFSYSKSYTKNPHANASLPPSGMHPNLASPTTRSDKYYPHNSLQPVEHTIDQPSPRNYPVNDTKHGRHARGDLIASPNFTIYHNDERASQSSLFYDSRSKSIEVGNKHPYESYQSNTLRNSHEIHSDILTSPGSSYSYRPSINEEGAPHGTSRLSEGYTDSSKHSGRQIDAKLSKEVGQSVQDAALGLLGMYQVQNSYNKKHTSMNRVSISNLIANDDSTGTIVETPGMPVDIYGLENQILGSNTSTSLAFRSNPRFDSAQDQNTKLAALSGAILHSPNIHDHRHPANVSTPTSSIPVKSPYTSSAVNPLYSGKNLNLDNRMDIDPSFRNSSLYSNPTVAKPLFQVNDSTGLRADSNEEDSYAYPEHVAKNEISSGGFSSSRQSSSSIQVTPSKNSQGSSQPPSKFLIKSIKLQHSRTSENGTAPIGTPSDVSGKKITKNVTKETLNSKIKLKVANSTKQGDNSFTGEHGNTKNYHKRHTSNKSKKLSSSSSEEESLNKLLQLRNNPGSSKFSTEVLKNKRLSKRPRQGSYSRGMSPLTPLSLQREDFYERILSIPGFGPRSNTATYKKYLNLRSKLAVQAYDRRSKRIRKKYHAKFTRKFEGRLPSQLVKDRRLFSLDESYLSSDSSVFNSYNGDNYDKHTDSQKPGSLAQELRNSHIINTVFLQLTSEDPFGPGLKSEKQDSLSFSRGKIHDKLNHASRGEEIENNVQMSDRYGNYSSDEESSVPLESRLGLPQNKNLPHYNSFNNEPVNDIISRVSKLNNLNNFSNNQLFRDSSLRNKAFLPNTRLKIRVSNRSKIDEWLNSSLNKNADTNFASKLVQPQGFESKTGSEPACSDTPLEPYTTNHDDSGLNKVILPVGSNGNLLSLAAERSVAENNATAELKKWTAQFRAIVSEGVPRTYKNMLLSLCTKQNNARKAIQLCQREVKRIYGPAVLRGGPLNTLGDNRTSKELLLRARRSMREVLYFWKRHEKDEREARKRAEKEALERLKLEEDAREATRQSRKLNFLITQTELYSHFVGAKIKGEQGNDVEEHEDESLSDLDFENATDEAIKARASRNAKIALAKQKEQTREFDMDASENLDMSEAVDSMNFQNPSTLGGNDETPQPRMLMCQLKEYQLKGLHWLASLYEQGINGILADEMGLGKTVQSISLMAYLAETHGIWGPFIVVAPASTLHNWQQEIARFTPELKVLPYWGTQKDRKILRKSFWNVKQLGRRDSNFHVLITSYQLVVSDEPVLNRVKWQYMVLDEAQAIKSSTSARWKILLQFKCRNRLLLTGTPIQNSMQELWALLHFIMPSLFDSHEEFSEWFSRDIESHAENNTTLNSHQIKRLHMILKPFMLRRIKKHVQHELGDKVEHFIYCNLTHRQAKMYSGLMQKISVADLMSKLQSSSASSADADENLMNLVMQFRKVCNHPELFERAEVASPLAFSNSSLSVLNRPGSQLLYSPSKSPIEFHMPKLLLSSIPGGLSSENRIRDSPFASGVLGRNLSIWNPENIFNVSRHNSNMSALYLSKNTVSILLGRNPSTEDFFDSFEMYNAKFYALSNYLDFMRSGPDSGNIKDTFWSTFGLYFTKLLSALPTYSAEVSSALSDLSSLVLDKLSFSASQLIDPACKPTAVALTPQIVSSNRSFAYHQNQFMMNHPLRHRIQPSIMKAVLSTKYNLSVAPTSLTRDLTNPFLKQGRTAIWTPSVDKLIRYAGKMAVIDPLLANLKADGHRVLIYFQMTRMIDLMEEYLAYRQYTYLRLDGSSKISDRRNMVMDWQTRPDIFIFLLSTRAGGLGINLTAADTVIFYDSDWNPTVDQQAMDRAHRLGQTKQVTVYRLITKGTIEERILERARQKDSIHKIVIAGGSTNNPDSQQNESSITELPSTDGDTDVKETAENTLGSSNLDQHKEGIPNKGSLNTNMGSSEPANNHNQPGKRKKPASDESYPENQDDGAFGPSMKELRPNDIVAMLIDETSGNDDLLWSKKLQSSRSVPLAELDLISKAASDSTSESNLIVDDNHLISGYQSSNLTPSAVSSRSQTASSATPLTIPGKADHLFDAYFASLELQNQIFKKNTSKRTGAKLKAKEPKHPRQHKKRTLKPAKISESEPTKTTAPGEMFDQTQNSVQDSNSSVKDKNPPSNSLVIEQGS